jgi:hypothetical protein
MRQPSQELRNITMRQLVLLQPNLPRSPERHCIRTLQQVRSVLSRPQFLVLLRIITQPQEH